MNVAEFMRRLTEGDKRWGTMDVSPAARGTWRRVRLAVYPPGTTSSERRALHFAHTWPISGAIICLVLMVTLGDAWPPALTIGAVVLLYVAGFWIASWLTRPLRHRVRTLTVVSMYVGGEFEEYGNAVLLRETTARLESLDSRRIAGAIDPVRYEAEWADIYATLPDEAAVHA